MSVHASLLRQIDGALAVAREAFYVGDNGAGIAAICLAAQLLQLARIWQTIEPCGEAR